MTNRAWPRSLEGRLLFRLAIVLAATLVGGLIASVVAAYRTAAELADEAAADRFVAEFLHDAGWVFPIFAAVVLLVAMWTIRASLEPLRTLSARASAIAPGAILVRLPHDGLPSEFVPVVTAVNEAFDRLAKGFETQRQFTADAAHELRTPLAILTAGLEALPPSAETDRLRQDAERMNRLVAQLLRVARLDAQPMDLNNTVDLGEVAGEVVEHIAPWAARKGRSIAFEPASQPVPVRGNRDALADAIRNLVENAIAHSPAGEEVVVGVDPQGSVSVSDHGPGVPPEHREKVFERFWRSRERRSAGTGAGLGLSIVAEIARVHAGRVAVTDASGGGACFILSLPVASPVPSA